MDSPFKHIFNIIIIIVITIHYDRHPNHSPHTLCAKINVLNRNVKTECSAQRICRLWFYADFQNQSQHRFQLLQVPGHTGESYVQGDDSCCIHVVRWVKMNRSYFSDSRDSVHIAIKASAKIVGCTSNRPTSSAPVGSGGRRHTELKTTHCATHVV